MEPRSGAWRPGAIVWRENATTDLARTTAFYSALLGWTHHDSEGGPMGVYRHFMVGETSVAGCYEISPHMQGMPAHWMQYVSVSDVDAATEAAKASGAVIQMGPMDIPDVGRATYIRDPQGASIALFRDAKGDAPQAPPPFPQGVFCWESLVTTDKAGSVAFYTKVVGHTVGDFAGNPTLGTADGPEHAIADLGDAPHGGPSYWMSHVVVDDLAVSQARAVELGATVLMGGLVVPTVGTMSIIQDPVGCVISLYQPTSR